MRPANGVWYKSLCVDHQSSPFGSRIRAWLHINQYKQRQLIQIWRTSVDGYQLVL